MGQVRAPFGVRGWVRVRVYTESLEGLAHYRSWWIGRNGQWREVEVEECRPHGKELVALVEGCDSRKGAELLAGSDIAIPRSQLPERAPGEYYWVDLVGLSVVNLEGVSLGRVNGLMETGANQVLQVAGQRERLIPFVEHVIRQVDLDGKVLTVDWGADY